MGVEVRWFEEENRSIIYYEFVWEWTWEEFERAYTKTLQMMDSVDHKVHFIVNMNHSPFVRPGSLQRMVKAARYGHPNMGLAVWVGVNRIMRAIASAIVLFHEDALQTYPFQFADSVAEAYDLITKDSHEWL
jgi:hypothetical protein